MKEFTDRAPGGFLGPPEETTDAAVVHLYAELEPGQLRAGGEPKLSEGSLNWREPHESKEKLRAEAPFPPVRRPAPQRRLGDSRIS